MRRIQSNTPEWGGRKYRSNFELEVFHILRKRYGVTRIKYENPVIVRPQTNWYKAQDWRCDFRIDGIQEMLSLPVLEIPIENVSPQLDRFYVEAKGIIDDEFKEKMKNLTYFRPDIFQRLIIVAPKVQTIFRGFITYDMKRFSALLGDELTLVNACKKEYKTDV
ncbi:MAG: hypothetical protein AAFO04_25380 [Cyanobacteria bacterium J06592_8]